MTPEERQLVDDLCKRIADEKDPFIFHQLVKQLDELLACKENRLKTATKPPDPDWQRTLISVRCRTNSPI
jgi:DNA replication initiation complex subunit (GINS family)